MNPFNSVWICIGSRGKGKTPFITGGDFEIGIAELYLKKHNMSSLAIDELDHVRYRDWKILHPKDYMKLTTHPGKYRTLAARQDLPGLVQRIATEKLVWNANVIKEDSHKYVPMKFTKDDWTLVGNCKQQNNNLFFMYWEWDLIPPDVIRAANYLVIFPTKTGPACREKLLGSCYVKCVKAHELVTKGKGHYYIVDTGL